MSTKLSEPQRFALRVFADETSGMSLWDAAIEVVNPRTLRTLMQFGYLEGQYVIGENEHGARQTKFLVGFRLTQKGIEARREAIAEHKANRTKKDKR